jgi:hypothetical protein
MRQLDLQQQLISHQMLPKLVGSQLQQVLALQMAAATAAAVVGVQLKGKLEHQAQPAQHQTMQSLQQQMAVSGQHTPHRPTARATTC